MFPEPTELLLIGCSIGLILDTKNPNQIHRHQKPTRRHFDQREFHTWWVESSFVFVQHQPFQFYRLFWSDGRKERKKIQVKKESQQSRNRWWIWSRVAAKGLLTCYLPLHQKAQGKQDMKVNYLWAHGTEQHERTERPVLGRLLIKLLWVECLTKNWSSQEWKSDEMIEVRTGETCQWTTSRFVHSAHGQIHCWTRLKWTLTSKQNQKCREKQDHSCAGWMIECERCGTNLQKMQCKTATNTLWYGECLCLLHYKHLYSWWRITEKIYLPSEIQGKNLTMKQMFDISEMLIFGQSDEIHEVTPIFMETMIFDDEDVISLSHAKFYVFSDSVLCLGKVHQNPQSNIVWEDKLTWFKSSLMEFEWNISCRCSTTSHWDLQKISKNANQALNPFRFM